MTLKVIKCPNSPSIHLLLCCFKDSVKYFFKGIFVIRSKNYFKIIWHKRISGRNYL